MINLTTSSHFCTILCMFFFSFSLLTRLSTHLFVLYSLFVCLYLHFVVYSSASDLKQQWEVNPSPTPSLQVDAFYSSHLCVFYSFFIFWFASYPSILEAAPHPVWPSKVKSADRKGLERLRDALDRGEHLRPHPLLAQHAPGQGGSHQLLRPACRRRELEAEEREREEQEGDDQHHLLLLHRAQQAELLGRVEEENKDEEWWQSFCRRPIHRGRTSDSQKGLWGGTKAG